MKQGARDTATRWLPSTVFLLALVGTATGVSAPTNRAVGYTPAPDPMPGLAYVSQAEPMGYLPSVSNHTAGISNPMSHTRSSPTLRFQLVAHRTLLASRLMVA